MSRGMRTPIRSEGSCDGAYFPWGIGGVERFILLCLVFREEYYAARKEKKNWELGHNLLVIQIMM